MRRGATCLFISSDLFSVVSVLSSDISSEFSSNIESDVFSPFKVKKRDFLFISEKTVDN
jgi:hypothetical protein